jgi:hypothetical protein
MLKRSIIACMIMLAGLGAVAQAQSSTTTVYWLCLDDSAIAEGVLPVDSAITPPDSGNWEQITLQQIHNLGRYSPSEEEAAAKEQGHWWSCDTTQLGKDSYETGWLVLGINTAGQKFAKAGAGSRRKYWPGRVMAKAVLRKDGDAVRSMKVDLPMWWEAKAITWPAYYYPRGESYFWTDSTEHYYGNPMYYYYHVWPGIEW